MVTDSSAQSSISGVHMGSLKHQLYPLLPSERLYSLEQYWERVGLGGLNNLAFPLFLGAGEHGREGRIVEVERMI